MRLLAAPLAVAVLAACAVPNPAFHASDGGGTGATNTTAGTAPTGSAGTLDPATTHDSASGSTSVSTTVSTADPTTHTSATTGPVDPSTSGPMTSTSTSPGTDWTSTDPNSSGLMSTGMTSMNGTDGSGFVPQLDLGGMMDLCPQMVAPDLALAVQHTPPPANCQGELLHGVFIGKADDDSLLFRKCLDTNQCELGNINCAEAKTITIHFNGPTTHVPAFDLGTCVQIGYTGTVFENANTCGAKFVRIGRIGENVATTTIYAAAVGVPDTALLPPPWPAVLEFSVEAALVEACGQGGPICGQPLGDFDLVGTFPAGQITVPYKTEKEAVLPVLDMQNKPVGEIPGTLFNLRSWTRPANSCEFKWIWMADDIKP